MVRLSDVQAIADDASMPIQQRLRMLLDIQEAAARAALDLIQTFDVSTSILAQVFTSVP